MIRFLRDLFRRCPHDETKLEEYRVLELGVERIGVEFHRCVECGQQIVRSD